MLYIHVEQYYGITKGRKIRKILPILRPLSVICLAVFRLPGNGVQSAPGLSTGLIDLALFLLGKLLVGDEFLHMQPPQVSCHSEPVLTLAWESPKSKEIATPVCGLVRNDSVFLKTV